MTKISRLSVYLTFTCIILLTCSGFKELAAQNPGNLKIGTYDSRIAVIAYTRSDLFMQDMMKNRNDQNNIMQSGDTAKMIETFQKVMTEQYLLHQQVFSNGSASAVLSVIKDKLPQLAKEKGVGMIVSKWELPYSDPSIELVDLTIPVAMLFNPKGDFESISGQMSAMDPIPLKELPMDEAIDMWKQFEVKYLGKN